MELNIQIQQPIKNDLHHRWKVTFGVLELSEISMFVVDGLADRQTPLPDYVSKQWEPLYNETKYIESGPQKAVDIKE